MLPHTYGRRASLSSVNADSVISRLWKCPVGTIRREEHFTETELINLSSTAREIFSKEPSLLVIRPPTIICGDVHGQYGDLLDILRIEGDPESRGYLFLGDYVDRGTQSIETIALLLAYKIKYPQTFYMLRGNHETGAMNMIYGFYDECHRRYTTRLWQSFVCTFDTLPFAAVVGSRIFACHGGLSPKLSTLSDVEKIRRPTKTVESGLVCDLLWADPDEETERFQHNCDRGVSYFFGEAVVNEFLEKNDLDLIVRAHQVVEDGYEFFAKRKLVTIFSARNFCGEYGNLGAVLRVNEELVCTFGVSLQGLSRRDSENLKKKRKYVYAGMSKITPKPSEHAEATGAATQVKSSGLPRVSVADVPSIPPLSASCTISQSSSAVGTDLLGLDLPVNNGSPETPAVDLIDLFTPLPERIHTPSGVNVIGSPAPSGNVAQQALCDVFGFSSAVASTKNHSFSEFQVDWDSASTAETSAPQTIDFVDFDAFASFAPVSAVPTATTTLSTVSSGLYDLFGEGFSLLSTATVTPVTTAPAPMQTMSANLKPQAKIGSTWAGTTGLIDLDNLGSKGGMVKQSPSLNEMQKNKQGGSSSIAW